MIAGHREDLATAPQRTGSLSCRPSQEAGALISQHSLAVHRCFTPTLEQAASWRRRRGQHADSPEQALSPMSGRLVGTRGTMA